MAAPTFDATAQSSPVVGSGATTVWSVPITIGSGSNNYTFIDIVVSNGGSQNFIPTGTYTITCGGKTFTSLGSVLMGNVAVAGFVWRFGAAGLASGSTTAAISITDTGQQLGSGIAIVTSYMGVGSVGALQTAWAVSTGPSLAIPSATGHLVCGVTGCYAATTYSATSFTQRSIGTAVPPFIAGEAAGASTTTLSTTESGAVHWGFVGNDLIPPTSTTVTPGGGSLAITGGAPAITATANKVPTPGGATPTITGGAPAITATANKVATPGGSSLSLTGGLPVVTPTVNKVATPGGGSLATTFGAPAISATANKVFTPGGGTLVLSGSAPAVAATANVVVPPGGSSLTVVGSAPVIGVSSGTTPVPGGSTVTITGSAPLVTATNNIVVTPGGAGTFSLTGGAPAVAATANKVVTPGGAGTLGLTGGVPLVTIPVNKYPTPGGASVSTTFGTPVISATKSAFPTPGALALSITLGAPAITATGNKVLTPGAPTLGLSGGAPVVGITTNKVATPGGGSLTTTLGAPALSLTQNYRLTPGANTLAWTGGMPATATRIFPGNAALGIAGSAPNVVLSTLPVSFVDYGYAQSELPWGTASPIPIDRPTVTAICQGIQTIGGSRVRMGVQVGSWDDLDYAVNAATGAGLKPLLVIIGNETLVSGSSSSTVAFASLCKAVALRYGPSGTGQVAEYEMYNECNDSLNAPKQAAAGYVEFLKAGYTAIHAVHASAYVMPCGTIPGPDVIFGLETNPLEWYTALYAAGAKDYMDGLAMHLYADAYSAPLPSPAMVQWQYMTNVRALMVAQGDSAKKIWITEVGTCNPGPGITTDVMERDWLKAMVDGILSYDWMGPFFIYSFENTGPDLTDANGSNFGCVYHVTLAPKLLKYAYCQSITSIPVNPVDAIKPTAPMSLTVSSEGFASWLASTDDVGVTVYRIYDYVTNVVLCSTGLIGQTSVAIPGLTPGSVHEVYCTAVDAAGNESLPSLPATFTTDAQSGSQLTFTDNFALSPSPPTGFVELGYGLKVVSGVCLPNTPTAEGDWYTVGPYGTDMASADHFCEIAQAAFSAYTDRYAMAGVQVSPDGKQGVWAFVSGNGQADSASIITIDGGVVTLRNAISVAPLGPTETLRLTPNGSTYTVERYLNGVATEVVSWADTNGDYSGATNHRAAIGFRHKLVGGIYYPPNGIVTWKAMDITPVITSGTGGTEAWTYAIVNPKNLGLVIATGLWENSI